MIALVRKQREAHGAAANQQREDRCVATHTMQREWATQVFARDGEEMESRGCCYQ
jgi:hypothetical protein